MSQGAFGEHAAARLHFEQLRRDVDAMFQEQRGQMQESMDQMQEHLLREQQCLLEESLARRNHHNHNHTHPRPMHASPSAATSAGGPAARPLRASVHHRHTGNEVGKVLSRGRCEKFSSELGLSEEPDKYRGPRSVTVRLANGWSKVVKKRHGPVRELVKHIVSTPCFDYICAALILSNSAFTGAHVEWTASNLGREEDPVEFGVGRYIFMALFFLELCCRLFADGAKFFCGKAVGWNIFDFSLVVMSGVELIIEAIPQTHGEEGVVPDLPVQKIIRIVRMIRVVRIIRILRFFRELRIMVSMIFDSLRSLLWLMVLLCLMLYAFAICFTLGAVEALEDHRLGAKDRDVMSDAYGNVMRSILSLFKAMSGGVSWGEMLHPWIADNNVFFIFLFLVFISFTIFAVLNIVTGVFVDGALQNTQNERDIVIQEEMRAKEKLVQDLRRVFAEIDKDDSGVVTYEEFEEHLRDPRMEAYFSALKLDHSDTRLLFSLIENEETGEVEIDDFVAGCLRMKGDAKSIDVQTLMFKHKQIHRSLGGFMDFVEEQFVWLEQSMAYLADATARTPSPVGLDVRGQFAKAGNGSMFEGAASTADHGQSPAVDRPDAGLGGSNCRQTPSKEAELLEGHVEVGQGLAGISLTFGSPLVTRPRGRGHASHRRATESEVADRPHLQQAQRLPGGDEGSDLLGKREDSCFSSEAKCRSREGTGRSRERLERGENSGRRRSREDTNRSQETAASRDISKDNWLVALPCWWLSSRETSIETLRMSQGAAAARAAALIDTGGMAALAAFEGDTDMPAGHEDTTDSFVDADLRSWHVTRCSTQI